MSRPVIAIDVDDVLAESAKAFVEYSNQKWGTTLTVDDYDEDWSRLWRMDHEHAEVRAQDYFKSGSLLRHTALDAHAVLERLRDSYDLIVVTSRRTMLKGDTLEWIQREFPGIFVEDKIFFAGMWDKITDESIHKTKGSLLKELGAHYHIDDQPKHCLSALEQGVKPLLFGSYNWNRTVELPEGIARVQNWQEVLEFFERELHMQSKG